MSERVFDLVVLSDCVYDDDDLEPLLRTICGVKSRAVLCAYKRRIPERELPFFQQLEARTSLEWRVIGRSESGVFFVVGK